jgi:hypothetical protein
MAVSSVMPADLAIFESARMDREMARELGQNSRRRNKKSVIGTALANMSTPRLLMLMSGILLVVGGLLVLRFPVFLSGFDQWGFQISCGTGFGSDWTQAATADAAGTHYVDQCHAAVAIRRAWAAPVVVAGASLLSALLIRPTSREATPARLSWLPSYRGHRVSA